MVYKRQATPTCLCRYCVKFLQSCVDSLTRGKLRRKWQDKLIILVENLIHTSFIHSFILAFILASAAFKKRFNNCTKIAPAKNPPSLDNQDAEFTALHSNSGHGDVV